MNRGNEDIYEGRVSLCVCGGNMWWKYLMEIFVRNYVYLMEIEEMFGRNYESLVEKLCKYLLEIVCCMYMRI